VRSLHNHYIWRLLWLHQPSSRNWVTKKVCLGYAKGVGRGVWTKRGICPSTWQKDTLGPFSDSCIYELASMWLGHGVCNVMKWVERLVKRGWTRYGDIGDLTSDKIYYRVTKGIEYCVYGSTKSFVECTWINMAFQNPMLIIDQRGVSIMSGVFLGP
jgi:hypothetical protein